jgi:hypothetical protein
MSPLHGCRPPTDSAPRRRLLDPTAQQPSNGAEAGPGGGPGTFLREGGLPLDELHGHVPLGPRVVLQPLWVILALQAKASRSANARSRPRNSQECVKKRGLRSSKA